MFVGVRLLLLHTATTKPMRQKFGLEIHYTLDLNIRFFLFCPSCEVHVGGKKTEIHLGNCRQKLVSYKILTLSLWSSKTVHSFYDHVGPLPVDDYLVPKFSVCYVYSANN